MPGTRGERRGVARKRSEQAAATDRQRGRHYRLAGGRALAPAAAPLSRRRGEVRALELLAGHGVHHRCRQSARGAVRPRRAAARDPAPEPPVGDGGDPVSDPYGPAWLSGGPEPRQLPVPPLSSPVLL